MEKLNYQRGIAPWSNFGLIFLTFRKVLNSSLGTVVQKSMKKKLTSGDFAAL
jgi:hypothetical protein